MGPARTVAGTWPLYGWLAAALLVTTSVALGQSAPVSADVPAIASHTVAKFQSGKQPQRYFHEGKSGGGQLLYISDVPVLLLKGSPEEMGKAEADLVAVNGREVLDYPRKMLARIGLDGQFARLMALGQKLLPQFPPSHMEEMAAFARDSGLDRDLVIATNTMTDSYRGGFACSSLLVEPQRSATKGPIFGRNLDFFGGDMLERLSLVVVRSQPGKHAFASVSFPGVMGCFSGMNDAGLAVAVHEVFAAADGSSLFNPKGVPYGLCFRRILEECTTIEEAETLLRSMERTTMLNLAVCDRQKAGVLEMTPKTVVLRRAEDGSCVCTNHFRSDALKVWPVCSRYATLEAAGRSPEMSVDDVARKMHAVNMGRFTLQTMIFEPATLVLHVAVGHRPASAGPLKRLELAPLFAERR